MLQRQRLTAARARLLLSLALFAPPVVFAAAPRPPGARHLPKTAAGFAGQELRVDALQPLERYQFCNVGNLRVELTFSTGVLRGHEAAPMVHGDTMYIVTPYPNHIQALDLSKLGAPLKWHYEPKPAAAAQGVACCDVVNRGASYTDRSLYFTTLDGQAIGLDANTGRSAGARTSATWVRR